MGLKLLGTLMDEELAQLLELVWEKLTALCLVEMQAKSQSIG